ncbi:MAG: hypothetical protein E7376_03400 [Clostridiales bacterium]|nr:hypothetical protein [Clostridiales bacterium]
MKADYQATLQKAKELNLITQDDKYVFCTVRPKDGKYMGVMQEVIYYKYDILFVINENEVKLIDIDQKTGSLVGSHKIISRENIIDLNDYWCFLSRDFYIKAKNPDYRENFAVCNKFYGFNQKEMLNEVRTFIQQKYTIPLKEAKKNAK